MKKPLFLGVIGVLFVTMVACQFIPANLPQLPATAAPTLPPAPTLILPQGGDTLLQNQDLLVSLFKQVNPGVVAVQVITDQGAGEGSGFVYDAQGHIITNYHVVQNNTSLEVDFPSGVKVHGKVIGSDLDSDLAVVKVDVPASELKPLLLGDSDQLQVGEMVVAIGNPFGFSSTMTMGIVSAKGRNLESIRQDANGRSFSAGDLIQTDAAINPGNSGGPLLNMKGEVVGVNRAIQTAASATSGEPVNSGISFAVSVNIVKKVVPVLISKGSYDYPYLGVSALDEVTLMLADALGLSQSRGAYLVEVVSGGPADQAGLKAGTRDTSITGLKAGGDLITAIDGQPVNVYADLIGYLMTQKSPGDKVVLTILRDGKEMQVTVTLGKRP
ncbi:MAG: trypsin-like peptidase domain-containing protein [Anaerolineaceae bacterium]